MIKEKSFYKQFFSLAFYLALQSIIVFSVNLADNLMLGAYSEEALSGVALANQIQFLLQMITTGVGEGIIVLAAQYWGKKQTEPIKQIIAIGLKIALAGGTILWAIVFFFPQGCMSLLTNDQAVIAEGVSYVKIICFTYFFFVMTNTMITALRSVETVKIGFVVPVITLCINVCLNYVFIYGNFGAPRLGAQGAAIATLVSRIVEFLIVAGYILFVEKKLCFRVKEFFENAPVLLKDYLRVASPVILSNTMWGIAMAIQTAILGRLGGIAIAANSIATTLFQILSVMAYANSGAASILIGKTVGEGELERVKQYAKTLQVLFLIVGLATGAVLFFMKDFVLSFYAISPETKDLAGQFINVLSITVCGTAYQVAVLVGIVRGGGDTTFVLINDTIFMWGIVLPLSALAAFVFQWPPVWVFVCLKCDQILKCFVAVVKVNRFKWIRQLTR